MKTTQKIVTILAVASLAIPATAAVTDTANGITATGPGYDIEVSFITSTMARVVKTPIGHTDTKPSLVVTKQPEIVKLKRWSGNDSVAVWSSDLTIGVNTATGCVTFMSAAKDVLLAEKPAGAVFTPMDDAGRSSFAASQQFRLEPNEQIYGLGILQNGKLSQRGEKRLLRTGNTDDGIPFFQSSKGYGLYWDNYSPTTIADDGLSSLTLSAEVADAVDYYFLYGRTPDGVIDCVRELTGDVPMSPLWAYGFMQCRERYKSQQEILDVLRSYRRAEIPVDCMIQDWQYWGNNYLWNAMDFLNENFPDPKAMINEIHALNARCMISIWQSFGPQTLQYAELDQKGLLFNMSTWPTSGISHMWPPRSEYPSGVRVYDCYNPEARQIYWIHLKRLLDLGLDAWWMDSTEPDHFDATPADYDHHTVLGTYRSLVNAFPMMTVGGVYGNQRSESDSARVFILTRSATFGQQRTGAHVWSGDVNSSWDVLRRQIPAGLNFSLTGNPNFNSDLGGFFAGAYNNQWQGRPAYENPAYRELYVRWMQQGILTPMMRSHGTDTPREIYYYGQSGEPVYDALVAAVKLRYSLLPYIYSTARAVSHRRDTFMRALAMDFPADPVAVEATDKYMFGRSLLATPVLHAHYTSEDYAPAAEPDFSATISHSVTLPAGADWYYFHDGRCYQGGSQVELDLTLEEAPLFVRAGSILPIGPDVQWTGEKPWDDLEIRIYPGADAQFTLYEDTGDGYGYESGQCSEISFSWDNSRRRLTISSRQGDYPGMLNQRTFSVRIIGDDHANTLPVAYSGHRLTVSL